MKAFCSLVIDLVWELWAKRPAVNFACKDRTDGLVGCTGEHANIMVPLLLVLVLVPIVIPVSSLFVLNTDVEDLVDLLPMRLAFIQTEFIILYCIISRSVISTV